MTSQVERQITPIVIKSILNLLEDVIEQAADFEKHQLSRAGLRKYDQVLTEEFQQKVHSAHDMSHSRSEDKNNSEYFYDRKRAKFDALHLLNEQ